MGITAKVMWRAFGRVWNGELTGLSQDGYSEVLLGPGSESWVDAGERRGWVLTSIIEQPAQNMASLPA